MSTNSVPGLEDVDVPVDYEIVDGPAPATITDPDLFDLFAITGIRFADDGTVSDVDAKSAGAYDASASFWLRRAKDADLELDRLKSAMTTEIALITARYQPQLERASKSYSTALDRVEQVAQLARDAGILEKKQSRDVGNGRFGWKKVAASVEIADKDAAIAWAKEHVPQIVQVETKPVEKLPVAALKPFIFGLVDAGQPVPNGVVHHPASVKYFAEIAE